MSWDLLLHAALRTITATAALAAFGFGLARALASPDVWQRRGLRLTGALVLLGVAGLSAVDVGTMLLRGTAPEDEPLDWLWLCLDTLLPFFFLLLIHNWRQRDRLEGQLAALSETDPLTGLPNRRGFLARALPAIGAARRGGAPSTVILFDLDRFKAINDGFGHPAGDAVLCGVGDTLAQAVRGADVAGRLGGEEFALLLPGDDLGAAVHAAERLRELVARRVPHPAGPDAMVTLSVGIAAVGPGEAAAALEQALGVADRALYAAKQAGRDRVVVAEAS